MKQRVVDFIIIVLLTFGLGQAATWVTDRIFFQIAFPQLIALQDFHWEDFVFKLRPDAGREERITLINISEGTRVDIARQIELISSYKPKVIGLDVFFNCKGGIKDSLNCPFGMDTLANRDLQRAIKNQGNVVLVSQLLASQSAQKLDYELYDSLEYSDPEFMSVARSGFGNLVETKQDTLSPRETRSFVPSVIVNEHPINSFAIEVASAYDSDKAKKYLERRTMRQILAYNEELINFRGNVGSYSYSVFGQIISKASYYDVIDFDELMRGDFHEDLIRDRIILLGYLGEDYLNDPAFEERFYTPLNPTLAGRSLPDMLGLVIQANIISMILNEDGINQMSPFWDFIVMLLVISLNVLFFTYLLKKNSVWYDSLGFLIPVIQIIIISWLRIELLASYNFRLDLENIIYLLAFVTFAVNIYFGPWKKILTKWQGKFKSKNSSQPEITQNDT